MELEWVAVLTSVFGLFSTLVAIWARVSKRRDESKHSQAEVTDMIADAAGDTIKMLNERATKEADARLAAEKRANTSDARRSELQERHAGTLYELNFMREGVGILIEQIRGMGQEPRWDPSKTKPLLTSAQVERMIAELLAKNGVAKRLNEVGNKE